MALIEVDDLSVTYGVEQAVHALRAVSLRLEDGEHLAIMGRSGSGKTTLLNVIGLLRRPTSGRYHLNGHSVEVLSERERCLLRSLQVGFVFQSFHLLPDRSVVENVATALLYQGVGRRERRERAHEALADVGMSQRAGFAPSQLSGGEQQRVVIARALVGRPSLLLCDEPTGDLDSRTAGEVLALLQEQVDRGRTLIVITHDQRIADAASRTLHLVDGELTS